MDSTRQSKIDRLVQKELGSLFQKMTNTLGGTIVSVTSVKVSSDLSIARVRLSIFPTNKVEETMALIKNSAKGIRFELGLRVKNQLRILPELTFFHDDSIDYIENIDRLLNEDHQRISEQEKVIGKSKSEE
ncbi:MAG: 30S ribosome-binding factor RbfA [Paludibacteraceae bacterium]|nr:30S ribosome-binding factor RbfA [Paludibacteraceae bacterium]MBR6041255.1 30S ribosome-binding factor RbfA [Paludibacteraceae bacterium]MCR5569284.1 30S ribosome-binding factor RbfA [Paludibacteraceae bacterium]